IAEVTSEIAEDAQQRLEGGLVGCALGRQCSDGASHVGLHAPYPLRLAVELRVGLDEGRAVVVDQDFQCNPELAAIAQDALMMAGDTGCAGVEVEMTIALPVDLLDGVGFDDAIAAAYGPHPPAGTGTCLQDAALVAGFGKTIGGGHA